MSDQDTPVLVGWPIASPHAFVLQGPTPFPSPGENSGDDAEPPVSMVPLPPGAGNQGPIFPVSGLR